MLVPAITGLAFIAYKHPLGFRKIALGIAIIISCILVGLIAYNYGSMESYIDSLYNNIQTSANNETLEFSINGLHRSKEIIKGAFIIYLLSMAYLAFLYFLPHILGISFGKTKT